VIVLLVVLLVPLVALAIVLVVWSIPGRPAAFTDASGAVLPNSVAEKVWLPINGVEQGLFVTSTDTRHPVLLYLHGGMPEFFLAEKMSPRLEQLFTVAWWEQRGSGLSYSPDASRTPVTLEQLVSDTLELTRYLQQRFNQQRIYLMGHSGGTIIGVQAVAQAHELFHAYIGVAQVARQLASELQAHSYMLDAYRRRGDTRMVRALEGAPVTPDGGTPRAYLAVRDEAMHRLGVGTTRAMRSVLAGIVLASLKSRSYTIPEKVNLWRAKAAAGPSVVWSELLAMDLGERVPRLQVPAYFLHGRHDYTCTYAEARAYFDRLEAPTKAFYTFEASAHSPVFEEPDQALRILREDVLRGRSDLADAR
jgi:pimeloyl-ACP methyl ester carboxylesterase